MPDRSLRRKGAGESNQFKMLRLALTERVADLEAGLLGPGVEGLGAGGRHGPAIVAADLVLRRAGGRGQEGEAGEPQTTRPPRHGNKATSTLWIPLSLCLQHREYKKSLGMERDSPAARGCV